MMNIYQRINKVMQVVKYVKKDAEVQGYKAVTHDQVVSVARQALIDNGIVIYPYQSGESQISAIFKTDGSATNMIRYSCVYDVHFVNMDNPDDRISVRIEAHANDNGDKAPGKALTYATKSALIKVLSLETGINDESREEVKEKIKKATQLPDNIVEQINDVETVKDLSNLWKSIQTKDRVENLTDLALDTMKMFFNSSEDIEELNQCWSDMFGAWKANESIKKAFLDKKQALKDAGFIDPISG